MSKNRELGIILDPKTGTPINSRLVINLGVVECCFKREIPAFEQVEMWSYVLTWDRKWLYIVTQFVPKGTVLPTHWLDPRFATTSTRSQLNDGRGSNVKVYATALSQYVFKLKRLTVPPSTVLEEAGLLPVRPGGWKINESVLDEEMLNIDFNKDGEFDWTRVEAQRRKGIELISQPNRLDLLHNAFDGGKEGAIGIFRS